MNDKITRQEAAEMLGVKQSRIYSLIRSGLMSGQKIEKTWYVSRQDLENYKTNRPGRGRPPKNKEST